MAPAVTYKSSVMARAQEAMERSEAHDIPAAIAVLGDLWPEPRVEADSELRAVALMAVGIVRSWAVIGAGGLHEPTKDMLSESVRLFDDLGDSRIYKAQTHLAHIYHRQGASGEAISLLDDVLSKAGSATDKIRAATTRAYVLADEGHYHAALATLETVRPLVQSLEPSYRGKFHNQEGVVLRRLGDTDGSLAAYTAAEYYFEVSRNSYYEAVVLNNRANIFLDLEMYPDAHESVDRAIKLLTSRNDTAFLAQVKDTKATILLNENRTDEALQIATEAVRLLAGDDKVWLPGILITRATILAKLKAEEKAKTDLLRAAHEAETTGNLAEAGRAYISMIELLSLPVKERAECYRRADGLPVDPERLRSCARKIISAIHPPREKHDHEEERELIKNTLLANGKNVEKAAAALGLSGPGLARIIDHDPYLIPFRKTKRVRRTSLIKK